MSLTDLAIVVVAGLVGFGLVSWVINVVRQQRAPPVEMSTGEPAAAPAPRTTASLAELGRTWQRTLGVSEEAGREEIEAAYRRIVAECDRVSSSPEASPGDRLRAAQRHAAASEAFEFVRTLRR
jgi:hypothetical protein